MGANRGIHRSVHGLQRALAAALQGTPPQAQRLDFPRQLSPLRVMHHPLRARIQPFLPDISEYPAPALARLLVWLSTDGAAVTQNARERLLVRARDLDSQPKSLGRQLFQSRRLTAGWPETVQSGQCRHYR